jgi:uncharacterized membrane protein
VLTGNSALLVLPHVVAVLKHSAAFKYGLDHFDLQNPIVGRLNGIAELFLSYLTFAAPGYLIVAFGVWKGLLAVLFPVSTHETN